MDIGAACLINGKDIPHILHAIAGGLLAARSFSGGLPTAVLGLALQEFMGILIAAVYIVATRRFSLLRAKWLPAGIAYGIVVYFVMNYVVLPLSAWHAAPTFRWGSFLANMSAMLLFGLIVAYFGSRIRPPHGTAFAGSDDPQLTPSA
ncbi:MAG TPA: hypothetical protein VGI93_21040 [Steroidobacteraceae bacterium]